MATLTKIAQAVSTGRILSGILLGLIALFFELGNTDAAGLKSYPYESFERPDDCASCHGAIYEQWRASLMSQSYTHIWDEIEYFKLAVPHAERDPVVAEVKAGCNGCHAPLAFMAGEIPPPRPAENSRANEGVSCDVCHTVVGFVGDTPFNFNFVSAPGGVKQGPRAPIADAPHEMAQSDFIKSPEFCGTCHNEKDPYGVWVKSTHLEWREGPYAKEGVRCQDCHMTYAASATVDDGEVHPDAAMHLFHGAHDASKLRGTVEIRMYPAQATAKPGDVIDFTISLFNQKAGHKFPTGSAEERLLWLHVEAKDASGKAYHLPVLPKGFEGEEYTIGSDALAYQDMSIALEKPDFAGVVRDGIPVGDRIFRLPYFDPQGRMTIQQWNTKSLGVDYRLAPRETRLESYRLALPADVTAGAMTITATLNYQLLPMPLAEFLGVPREEAAPVVVNEQAVTVQVVM